MIASGTHPTLRRMGDRVRSSYFVAGSILLAWIAVALAAGQGLTATQGSQLLLKFGACDGLTIGAHQWWRLITAQWLHARFGHMLFNAAAVAFAGGLLERRLAWWRLWLLYLLGGGLATLASAWAYPSEVSYGASQAMLVLCGAALAGRWTRPRPSKAATVLLLVVAIQLALDLKAIHTIKAGHLVGLAIGLIAGMATRFQVQRPALTTS
jgi:rhomboid protease GluP